MIGATLTTRLAQDGIDKKTVTAFTLAFRSTTRRCSGPGWSTALAAAARAARAARVVAAALAGALVIAAVVNLALVDPKASIQATVVAAVLVGLAGATYDIVIDAYRIETLKPHQLGVGSACRSTAGASARAAGALALVIAARAGWSAACLACAAFAAAGDADGPRGRRAGAARRGEREARARRSGSRSPGRSSSSCAAGCVAGAALHPRARSATRSRT